MKYQFYRTDETQLWNLRFLHFFGGTSEKYYKIFLADSKNVCHLPPTSKVPLYLDRILQNYRPATESSDLLAAMYIVQLLIELILNIRSSAQNDRSDYAREIAQYIDEHFAENITLDSLSSQFSLGKSYLPKKFKSQFGITPTEYLAQVRIKRAKELLHSSDYPVSKIAELVGIYNISYFIKLFKTHEALTPCEYRKKWKNSHLDIRRYIVDSQNKYEHL